MKKMIILISILLIGSYCFCQPTVALGQENMSNGYGLNFESTKSQMDTANKLHVKIGTDMELDYQSLVNYPTKLLVPIGEGINFPMANMRIIGFLSPGIKLHVELYLANPHHTNTYVKDGYLLIDKMPFIKSDVIDNIMQYVSLKVGDMEANYGDEHFRRSDGGNVIRNPFIGNYIMDAFTTMPAAELNLNIKGFIAMIAAGTGTLNQTLDTYNAKTGAFTRYNTYDQLAYYAKIGYDKQFTDDLRVRVTVSGYHLNNNQTGSLYNGDRAGTFYALVMQQQKPIGGVDPTNVEDAQMSGYWEPGSANKDNNVMINALVKYKGFEFFGTSERASGTNASTYNVFDMSQNAAELIYHFGPKQQFYGAARWDEVYNNRYGNKNDISTLNDNVVMDGRTVSGYQLAAGWFLTKNILAKFEYVNRQYYGFTNEFANNAAGFNGWSVQTVISF